MLSLLLSFSAAAENLESDPVAELSVASINIWGLSWPIAKQRGQRMRALSTLELDSYDVVGMQEVWRGAYRRIPWRERIQRPAARGDSGLALTGQLPLLTTPILIPFTASAGVERLKGKGILISQIAVPDIGPVWVYVTHFQAGSRVGDVRAAQAEELLALLADSPGPSIVIGDFNLYQQHERDAQTEQRLAGAGLQDVALALENPQATYIADNPYIWKNEDGERFDRIYLRSGEGIALEAVETAVLAYEEPLSDHQPLTARIRVRRDNRKASRGR